MANRTKRTRERVDKLLFRLRAGWSIGGACQAAGIGRTTLHEWRVSDSELDIAVDAAIEDGTDILEDVMTTVAIQGNVEALKTLLRARRPAKYRETQVHIHGSKPGEPIRHKHEHEVTVYDHSTLTPEQQFNLDQLLADVQAGKVTS